MKLFYTLVFTFVLSAASFAQSNPALTAVYEKEKGIIKLRWQHTDETVTSYIIQRSSDNLSFTDICTKTAADLQPGEFLKCTDDKIPGAKNYYRLKVFRGNPRYEATLPVMVIPGNTGNGWLMYPVPVTDVLNLQYAGSGAIQGVISVVITSITSGTEFTRLRMASTTRNIRIPVNNIGRGTYDIRVYIGNEVVWNQRFVK